MRFSFPFDKCPVLPIVYKVSHCLLIRYHHERIYFRCHIFKEQFSHGKRICILSFHIFWGWIQDYTFQRITSEVTRIKIPSTCHATNFILSTWLSYAHDAESRINRLSLRWRGVLVKMTAPGKRFSFILKFSEELKKIDYRYIRRAKVKCSYPYFQRQKIAKNCFGQWKKR